MRFLLFVVIGLAFINIVGQFSLYFLPYYPLKYTFASLFNFDGELTIPAVYSASALLLTSILMAIIASAKKIAGDHRYVRHWRALSIIFLYLSLDELIGLHELLTNPAGSALYSRGFLYQSWLLLGAALILACLLSFMRFLAALPTQTRRLFLIAGTLFFGGAIGIKLVGGYYADLHNQLPDMTYSIITTIKKLLEMLAIVVLIYALLSYMSSYMKGVSVLVNIIDDRKQRRSA